MPSPAMRERISAIRAMREAAAGQPPPTLAQTRANFDARSELYPLPDDVTVTAVDAGGVPAHWLAAAGVDVTLELGEGLPHVYPGMAGTPEAAAAADQAGAFLREKLRP